MNAYPSRAPEARGVAVSRVFSRTAVAFFTAVALALPAGRAAADFFPTGWIADWLVYGPLLQSYGAAPEPSVIRMDYLTDGVEFFEATILPVEGLEVLPDFIGEAAADGFHPVAEPGPVAWRAVRTSALGTGDTLDFNRAFGTTVEQVVSYAVCYIRNPGAETIRARVEIASDDSIQVKLDDCEILLRSVGRGFGGQGQVQDSEEVEIAPGPHRVLVKVFNGCCGYGFRLRFADAETGTPLTDTSTPRLETALAPADLDLTEIAPVGLEISRAIDPDVLIGLDKTASVSLSASRLSLVLDEDVPVTVREALPPGTALVAGSATPPPDSVAQNTLEWTLQAGDLLASGIAYELAFDHPVAGDTPVQGVFTVGKNGACETAIGGESRVRALPDNSILLGDIVGGGDGRGSAPGTYVGINLDTGMFQEFHENTGTQDLDGINPAEVVESSFVNSVFFLNRAEMPIHTGGVTFRFQLADVSAGSYNHVLSNVTHDIDKGIETIRVGGREDFATCVAIHASAGITFDLDALRSEYGGEAVAVLTAFIGTDACGLANPATCGTVGAYVIFSTEDEVLEDLTWYRRFGPDQGEAFEAAIPPEAVFLTFAIGQDGDGICCDHGVFAEARIFPEPPQAVIRAEPLEGVAPLEVSFDGTGSTSPRGAIRNYLWDFGDGIEAEGAQVTHTYQEPGVYRARLTVLDEQYVPGSAAADITVLCPAEPIAGWTATDVGSESSTGGARGEADCLELCATAAGFDAGDPGDVFHFLHRAVTGDFTVRFRLEELAAPAGGFAGLVARTGLEPEAREVAVGAVVTDRGTRAAVVYRREDGDGTTTAFNRIITPPDVWLELVREGASITGNVSTDGTTFRRIRTIQFAELPETLFVGFGGAASPEPTAGSTRFRACSIEGFEGSEEPRFRRGDTDGNGRLELTDAVRILGFLFLGQGGLDCLEAADADDNGRLELTDAVRILGFLFLGGTPIPDPGPEACGTDPEGSPDLGCSSYPGC